MDSYELQANVSSFLMVVVFPFLTANGVADVTANAVVGGLSYFIVLVISLWGERFVSGFLTKDKGECGCGSETETA